jgi:carbamoyltransferase
VRSERRDWKETSLTTVLGISAFYHDSAACLVADGEIVAAAQEERFTRKKYDAAFPRQAVRFCLRHAGLTGDRLDYVAFYDKPFVKFDRLLETYLSYAPVGFQSFARAMPVWLKKKLFIRREIREALGRGLRAPVLFLDHHESHAASAFFPSPYEEAAILTLDGVGEWSTAAYGSGSGNKLHLTHELQFPHSLGLLYSAFTYYCGFKVNSGEYKLMGLAPYGKPVYEDLILRHLVDLKADGSLWLNMEYFNYCQGLTMTGPKFHELFGGPPRKTDSTLEQRHMDLAASVQRVTEECVLRMGRRVHEVTGHKNLVMAGGVALNCVANGRLLREGLFENIWIQPAAGDAGGALGAALFVWHQLLEKPRHRSGSDVQKASWLGPEYSRTDIDELLSRKRSPYERLDDEGKLIDRVAGLLAAGKVVGWFHGRAEFGPRALGARSILGDARSAEMQATINLKIKFRESFRPFAPVVLREHVHEWFATRPGEESPYMLMVAPVLDQRRRHLSAEEQQLQASPDLVERVNVARSTVPAITHVDYSARIQTIDERHGRFYRLMQRFHEKTGCPVLINTSFNLSWEPIVLTPEEAYHTFMQSEMDVLVLENVVLHKGAQPVGLRTGSKSSRAVLEDPSNPWVDPVTGDALAVDACCARNLHTGKTYPVEAGIPRLFVPTDLQELAGRDVTDLVKQFYEKTPFPNYEDIDTPRALLEKAREGLFARLLNEQIPYDARVVEIGCGTGQLTNFLSIAHRSVLGVDVCLNSLGLAHAFKSRHGLDRASFAQMNLFRPALKDEFFDVVVSNGVLHHTGDARVAFERIGRLVRPGGHLVVGLYNSYSRSLHYARRSLFRWTGVTGRTLDPHFRDVGTERRRDAWFQDQYCHPHETAHTIDEVLDWMDADGFDFVNSIPKPTVGATLAENEQLFEPRSRGTSISRVASQVAALANGYREGGFFIMIGQKRARHSS